MRHSSEQIDLIEAIANTIIYVGLFPALWTTCQGVGVIWVFEHP